MGVRRSSSLYWMNARGSVRISLALEQWQRGRIGNSCLVLIRLEGIVIGQIFEKHRGRLVELTEKSMDYHTQVLSATEGFEAWTAGPL